MSVILTEGDPMEGGTTNEQARAYVEELLGDGDATAPPSPGQRAGKPYFHYFAGLSEESARAEFLQVKQLPEHYRERDLIERLGLDGRVA